MKDAKQLIQEFLIILQSAPSGNQVQFSIDYMKDEITIVSAPSGFVRFLYSNDRVCAHLRPEGLKVQMFK